MTPSDSAIYRLACKVHVGLADWRDVEAAALEEVSRGRTDAAIVALASVNAGTADLSRLLEEALSAEGLSPPDEAAAAMTAAVDIARQTRLGDVVPIEGARALWRLARAVPTVEPRLRVFVGLAGEWEDDPINRGAYDLDIVSAAQELEASCGDS